MKMVKMLALASVVAVGVVCASATKGEDTAPAVPATPADASATNVCAKCGMDKSKCACKKHKHHKKGQDAAASTNTACSATSN